MTIHGLLAALVAWGTHAPLSHAQGRTIWDPAYVIYYNGSPAVLLAMLSIGAVLGLFLHVAFPRPEIPAAERAYVVLAAGISGNLALGVIKTLEYGIRPIWMYHVDFAALDAVVGLGCYTSLSLLAQRAAWAERRHRIDVGV
jgi:hypothetical protein